METKKIKAVFFDLDGTLIDTERYYYECWPKAFEKYGYKVTHEQHLALRSLGRPFICEYMKKILGDKVEKDCEDIRKSAREFVNVMINNNGLPLKKGVIKCLEFLKTKDVKIVIVTATAIERTDMCVTKVDIKKYFDEIVSATEVELGKPAPDVYLYACQKLHVKPEEVIAVEDSPNGSNSAISAGCNTIMVPDLTMPDVELESKLFGKLNSLEEFEDFVKMKEVVFINKKL